METEYPFTITLADLREDVPAFGWHAVINLRECPAAVLEEAEVIKGWATGLVEEIGMKAYGPTLIEHFGHDDPVTAGYTCVQLIETSSITAHFSPHLGTAYIDVFSCREFSAQAAAEYSALIFRARSARMLWVSR